MPASASAWSAPTAPARPLCCVCSPTSTGPTRARCASMPAPASACFGHRPRSLPAAPVCMLLDEPRHDLDIDTTRWLEDFLAAKPEGMIVVSHDRYFLDRVVNKVFELHGQRISSYPGNFKQYWRLRQERYEQELKAYEAQREYIEKQEEYIRRVHYGQLHKQAASRPKHLDKIERLERPTRVEAPRLHVAH